MILKQVILVAAFALLATTALRSRRAHSVEAWKKLGFCLLMVTVVVAVIFPALVDDVAQSIGVGRGADLVLYVVSVTFGFYVVNQYLRGQDVRNELHRLARRIAIVEAVERYGLEPHSPASTSRAKPPQPGAGPGEDPQARSPE